MEYDETSKTGLRWKKITGKKVIVGDDAGCLHHTGYYQTRFNRKFYRNHRIVYFLHHGCCPDIIDHIDNNTKNNNINNLREATLSNNGHNRKIHKNNKLGHKNIYPVKNGWGIQLRVKGEKHNKSLNKKDFTIDDAIKIRDKMIEDLCGEFGNNGT